MSALDYFLKANLYGLLFAGCYALFLRRHTFLNVNRAYLLLSAVLSLALPLASLPTQTVDAIPLPAGIMTLPISVVATAPVEPAGPDWTLLGVWAYGLIAFGLVLQLVIQLSRLMRLIRQSERQVRDGYVLVLPPDQTTPTFSFFRYVVLNPADVHNELILNHELIHVRQFHSADVLGLALLRAVFWPVLALIFVERALRHVHEFLADRTASGSQANNYRTDYAQFLVEYTFGVRPDVLTNGFFNPSLLKQRILMLRQRATNRWALGKYVLVLPLALGLLAMTTAREEIAVVVKQATDETITVLGKVIGVDGKPLPGAHVVIKGTKTGTTTNAEGRYTLSNVPKDASLVVSFIGFASQTAQVKGRKTINVLIARAVVLNEVVVTGYEPLPNVTPTASSTPSSNSGEVFTVVEQIPEFPGGMSELGLYLIKNLRYPAEARKAHIEGRVFVQFVVTETGAIQNLRILKGIGFGCNEEAVRVVSQMPKWNPGKQNGKPVAVMYNLPIQFELEKREDKRTGQSTQPSSKTFNTVVDNSPNARFSLYNDVNPKAYSIADSALRSASFRKIALYHNTETGAPVLTDSSSAVRIRINGRPLSLFGVEPLYLLNGEEISSEIMKSLNPKTIESITVLKDASARAYGEKGKNGVVIVTTKKP